MNLYLDGQIQIKKLKGCRKWGKIRTTLTPTERREQGMEGEWKGASEFEVREEQRERGS